MVRFGGGILKNLCKDDFALVSMVFSALAFKSNPFYNQPVRRNSTNTEPVFLNVYGAQELIPRNEFRQPMWPGGPVR